MIEDANATEGGFWLFAYGSLVWKPPPHIDERVPGYITGHVRRFWQASEDHRGTPEAPGRVVTLIDYDHWKSLGEDHHTVYEKVWGVAYHVPEAKIVEVRDYLDIREINGYSIRYTPFYPAPSSQRSGSEIKCLVYIGLPQNPQFIGRQDPDQLARLILESRGPSGENKEYLYRLEQALLALSDESADEHVSDLASRCRALEASKSEVYSRGQDEILKEDLQKMRSTQEQEEV